MLAENKTIGRYPARATLDKLKTTDAQKTAGDFGGFAGIGAFGAQYGFGGVGRNQDISYNKYGAANAYRLVPPINRAVKLRADAHNNLPWKIIRNATNDSKNDVIVARSTDNHPAHPFAEVLQKLYHRQKKSLFWLMEYAGLVYGEIFIEYLKNDVDIVRGLKWLNPLAVYIDTRYGEIYQYLYSDLNGQVYIPLSREDVAYTRDLNPVDDWRGLSPVNVVVEKINIYRNVNRTTEAKFRNMARPDVVVSPPDNETSWTDIERNKIRDEMRRNFQGSDNAGSAMVAPRALHLDTFEQANLEEQYQINDPVRKEIYEEFGVPLAMAGDNTGTTYQNNDATLTWFYQNTIIPSAKERQFFVNSELLKYFDPYGDSRFEFDTSAYDLVSADDQTRATVAGSNYDKGVWTFQQSRVYTKESAIGDLDFIKIDGIPIPLNEVGDYWKYKLLVKPAPQEAGVVGTELQIDTPKQGAEITAQAGSGGGSFGKALATSDEPNLKAFCYLPLPSNPKLIAIQNQLKEVLGNDGIEWQDPTTFHVTLLYCNEIDNQNLRDIATRRIEFSPIAISASHFGVFDNEDEHALYLAVDKTPELSELQKAIHQYFTDTSSELSPFSAPDQYTPHITMGYLPARIVPTLKPDFKAIVDHFAIGRDDYQPFATVRSATPAVIPGKALQVDAESELKAWEKKLSKNLKATFEPHHLKTGVGRWLSHQLEHAENAESMKALFTTARDVLADSAAWDDDKLRMLDSVLVSMKSYTDTENQFISDVMSIIHQGNGDDISKQKFSGSMRSLIRRSGLQAMRDGMNEVGYDPESLSMDELAAFRGWQSEQSGYISNLANELFRAGITSEEVDARANMWANVTLESARELGLLIGKPDQNMKWVEDGTDDKCEDCLRLNGQVHSMKAWVASGWTPTSGKTKCKSFNCLCQLRPTDEAESGDY